MSDFGEQLDRAILKRKKLVKDMEDEERKDAEILKDKERKTAKEREEALEAWKNDEKTIEELMAALNGRAGESGIVCDSTQFNHQGTLVRQFAFHGAKELPEMKFCLLVDNAIDLQYANSTATIKRAQFDDKKMAELFLEHFKVCLEANNSIEPKL